MKRFTFIIIIVIIRNTRTSTYLTEHSNHFSMLALAPFTTMIIKSRFHLVDFVFRVIKLVYVVIHEKCCTFISTRCYCKANFESECFNNWRYQHVLVHIRKARKIKRRTSELFQWWWWESRKTRWDYLTCCFFSFSFTLVFVA